MLKFYEEGHVYTYKGVVVPSVSEIMQEAGISPNPEDLPEFVQRRFRTAALFGKKVHKACHLYDLKDLDVDDLDRHLVPYLQGWVQFKKDMKFKVVRSEKPIFSKKYRFAGTPDRIGYVTIRGCKRRAIVDIKTSVKVEPWVAVQIAGYEILTNSEKRVGGKVKAKLVVHLRPDGTYRLLPPGFFRKSDTDVFFSALRLWNFKKISKVFDNPQKV